MLLTAALLNTVPWRQIIVKQEGSAVNYSTDFKSIRNEVSAQEWQARLDLAACYRLVDAFGMTDLIYNHIRPCKGVSIKVRNPPIFLALSQIRCV